MEVDTTKKCGLLPVQCFLNMNVGFVQLLHRITSKGHLQRTLLNSTGKQRNCIVSMALLLLTGAAATINIPLDARVTLDFGRTLQQARTSKGWTQKDLATVSMECKRSALCPLIEGERETTSSE